MPAGATYEPIATTTLSSNASSVTFSSIPQTYTDLVLIASVCGYYASGTWIECGIQVGNGSIDTTSNYNQIMVAYDSPRSSAQNTNYARFWNAATPTNAGWFAPLVVHIQNYSNTTTRKPFYTRFNALQGASYSVANNGNATSLWRSTSAIDTVRVGNFNGTDFYSGSTFTLYGIAAA